VDWAWSGGTMRSLSSIGGRQDADVGRVRRCSA
jgi:hypothetical protein